MHRTSFALITAGALLAASQAMAAPSAADPEFAVKAAKGGLSAVMDGQLAQQKAASPQVKQFGGRMVQDHSQANQALQQIGQQENLNLPTKPDTAQENEDHRLNRMSGSQFDSPYIRYETQDRRKDVADFRREAQSGQDPGIKGFAQKYLPVIEQHLQMAESLNGQR